MNITIARASSVLTLIYLLLSVFFLMKSSSEFYPSKEESKTYDDFLSESSYINDQEPPSKLYEEEELNLNDEIISDKEIDESNEELTSKLYGEEETDETRGFRQIGNLKFEFLDLLIFK